MKNNLPLHLISKSGYQKGLQCVKSLYLYKFHPELRDELSNKTKEIFDTGHEVGKYAQQLFPGGVDCGYEITNSGQKSVELTTKAISEGKKVIYEAAFQFEEVLVIADIIVKIGNKWKIYEVKSSTKLADYQINDTSIQYYVISKCGIEIEDISVVHLNNQYIRKCEIDVNQLFTIESVKEQVIPLQNFVEQKIKEFKEILSVNSIPNIDIGQHCNYPYDCDFKGYCWNNKSDDSVSNLSTFQKKGFELNSKDISDTKDIPDDNCLKLIKSSGEDCCIEQKKCVEKKEINSFLSNIEYPLYFLGFESFRSAIPLFDNSRPYQQIVFHYSLYNKRTKDSEPLHFEFLGNGKTDPRQEFIESLLKDIGNKGTILVYNSAYEISRLRELAANFPQYAKQIQNIIERIVDLMTPFKKRKYFLPDMKSKHSIMKVSPAKITDYFYITLEIQTGSEASSEYLKLMKIQDDIEIQKIRNNLLDYCGRDTYGMIVILDELERVIKY